LEIVIFSTKNSTTNNFVNFQSFLTKCCTVIDELFGIIGCKFCLNRLSFSYFIIKRVWLQLVAYNNGFRLLLNERRCASSLFVYHNVPTFDALIRKLIYALWRSCHNSSNVLVDKLLASDIYFESILFKRWRQLLY